MTGVEAWKVGIRLGGYCDGWWGEDGFRLVLGGAGMEMDCRPAMRMGRSTSTPPC